MELSKMEVGEISQVKLVECEYCNHTFLARVKGYFINWFGKHLEFVLRGEVECENCLRDTSADYESV